MIDPFIEIVFGLVNFLFSISLISALIYIVSLLLQAVISQILLPRLGQDGQVHGRVAAFEIMTTTDAIRSRIRDNKTNMIKSDMQTGAKFGMTTLDTSLTNLFKQGLIAYEELITKSQDPDSVVTKLREEGYGS